MTTQQQVMHDAYGDESCGLDAITYATILIAEENNQSICEILSRLKTGKGIAPHEGLHCRVLFSGSQRSRSAWASLTMDEVFDLYENLIEASKPLLKRCIICAAKRRELPPELTGGPMQHADPNHRGPVPHLKDVAFGEKQIASFCANATTIPLSKWPGFSHIRFWPDPDKTKIDWFTSRKSFQETLGFFVSTNGNGGPSKPNVMKVSGQKPSALEIADAVAYISQRAIGAGSDFSSNARKFKHLYQTIAPEVLRLKMNPDGGLVIKVPDTSTKFRG